MQFFYIQNRKMCLSNAKTLLLSRPAWDSFPSENILTVIM